MIFQEKGELVTALEKNDVKLENGRASASDMERVRASLIDDLVWTAVFSSEGGVKHLARNTIHDLAWQSGAVPSSIQDLYEAIGQKKIDRSFTVPAHNIRTLTYDVCCALFRAAIAKNVGAFILEIARSEIGYTEQRPAEYAACVLASAVKEGFQGPVFIQGDHFQASAKKWFGGEREAEVEAIQGLIKEALDAEFYNIDIDTSTLVQLDHDSVARQQKENYEGSAIFTKFIRENEPEDVTISVGGEIGEVGAHNTSPEEFREYIGGYLKELPDGMKGVSKVSIQTGTSHGGIPLPDGSVAEVSIDFDRIREITKIAQDEFGISGAVQHGASTLPEEVFDEFPKADTVEIHLATGFQNIIYDHEKFPSDLRDEIRKWCEENRAEERKEGQTDEQFFYKTRKRALGPYKRQIWDLPNSSKTSIMKELEEKFSFLFEKLGVTDTKDLVSQWVKNDDRTPPRRSAEAAGTDAMAFVVEGEGE
ncbi:MAG: class II fructose-bisphosphate aldolase [Thermoanaerobaculia bacterium]|nr:class II fructose-bisphosphate aldolase [Thermoanaerobaculia bacterium]